MEKKFHRIPSDSVLGGVAAGMAEYFGIDKSLVRALWVASLILPIPPTFGWTMFIYIILWIVLPEGAPGATFAKSSGSYSVNQGDKPSQTVKILGIALIVFGAVMLIDEFPIWFQIKHYFWPAALILLGLYLLLNQKDKAIIDSEKEPIITPPPAPQPPAEAEPAKVELQPDPTAPKPPSVDNGESEEDGGVIKVN